MVQCVEIVVGEGQSMDWNSRRLGGESVCHPGSTTKNTDSLDNIVDEFPEDVTCFAGRILVTGCQNTLFLQPGIVRQALEGLLCEAIRHLSYLPTYS
jgi:hypothetical protein